MRAQHELCVRGTVNVQTRMASATGDVGGDAGEAGYVRAHDTFYNKRAGRARLARDGRDDGCMHQAPLKCLDTRRTALPCFPPHCFRPPASPPSLLRVSASLLLCFTSQTLPPGPPTSLPKAVSYKQPHTALRSTDFFNNATA